MAFTYEITEGNVVNVYADDNAEPCLVQDIDPATGLAWKSKTAATKWADIYVNGIEDRVAQAVAEMEAFTASFAKSTEEPAEPVVEPEPAPEA